MSDYDVSLINDSMQEFYVKFKGPEDSEYIILKSDIVLKYNVMNE